MRESRERVIFIKLIFKIFDSFNGFFSDVSKKLALFRFNTCVYQTDRSSSLFHRVFSPHQIYRKSQCVCEATFSRA